MLRSPDARRLTARLEEGFVKPRAALPWHQNIDVPGAPRARKSGLHESQGHPFEPDDGDGQLTGQPGEVSADLLVLELHTGIQHGISIEELDALGTHLDLESLSRCPGPNSRHQRELLRDVAGRLAVELPDCANSYRRWPERSQENPVDLWRTLEIRRAESDPGPSHDQPASCASGRRRSR